MIKGITLVCTARDSAEFERLASFFRALGFEAGREWTAEHSRGAPFLAPVGTVEFVTGKFPRTPEILIETVALDSVREAAARWAANAGVSEKCVGSVEETDWRSRMFIAEPVPGTMIGFWESDHPHHGKPLAVEGDLSAAGMRFGVVVSRWNAVITERLLQGALDALLRSGAKKSDVRIVRVPGAWEIPAAARMLADSGTVDAVVTLGVLLRGDTAHYEAIYTEVSRGIGQSQQETGVPHSFGVLTCETLEQALDRAGLKMGNKGFEAGVAAIEMVSVKRQIGGKAPHRAADR